jgi:hypothetical protein
MEERQELQINKAKLMAILDEVHTFSYNHEMAFHVKIQLSIEYKLANFLCCQWKGEMHSKDSYEFASISLQF